MSIRFDGQHAVITGAGSGLGRSYARYLAARGANVVVNDLGVAIDGRNPSELPARKVVDEIVNSGGNAIPSFDDVSNADGAAHLIEDAVRQFGPVDILICNAGVLRDRSLSRMPPADFELVVRVHLLGTAYVTQKALPQMAKRDYGRIVFTTSTSGLYGCQGQTNYGSAKLAVVGLMKSLTREVASSNIRINTVAPLAVTRQTRSIFREGAEESFGTEKIAALVAYLSSPACTTSGDIIVAGAGHYAKVEMLQSPGASFDRESITPEEIAERYSEIVNMEGAVTYSSGGAALTKIVRLAQGHSEDREPVSRSAASLV